MKQMVKQLTEMEKKKLKADLKNILEITEKSYDQSVTFLLKTIDKAEKKRDLETIKKCKKAAQAWIGFFEGIQKDHRKRQ